MDAEINILFWHAIDDEGKDVWRWLVRSGHEPIDQGEHHVELTARFEGSIALKKAEREAQEAVSCTR